MINHFLYSVFLIDPSGIVQSINQAMFDEKESLHINFTDLLSMEKRGQITHFNISINKLENPWDSVNDTTQFFEIPSNNFTWSINGLDNYTEYYISITAYTHVGPGPTRNATYRTAVNGNIILPTTELLALDNILTSIYASSFYEIFKYRNRLYIQNSKNQYFLHWAFLYFTFFTSIKFIILLFSWNGINNIVSFDDSVSVWKDLIIFC